MNAAVNEMVAAKTNGKPALISAQARELLNLRRLHSPTQRGGGEPKGREGVPGVVLAIAERSFPVFPCLAPDDGGQPDMEPARTGNANLRTARPLFESVVQRRVMIDSRAARQPFENR